MAAKNHEEFCKSKHLLTTGNCHMVAECEECKEIWEAATNAKEENFNSSQHTQPNIPRSCNGGGCLKASTCPPGARRGNARCAEHRASA